MKSGPTPIDRVVGQERRDARRKGSAPTSEHAPITTWRPRSVSATTTLLFADSVLIVDATAAARTVNLMTAALAKGRVFTIVALGTNVVTIDPAGAELINGAATYTIKGPYSSVIIHSGGTNWTAVARAGDTITGNLTINGTLRVDGAVSFGDKLTFTSPTNSWIDASALSTFTIYYGSGFHTFQLIQVGAQGYTFVENSLVMGNPAIIQTNAGNAFYFLAGSGQTKFESNQDKIVFGSAEDTNLFRFAADVLRTNDSLMVDGSLLTPGASSGRFLVHYEITVPDAASGNVDLVLSSIPGNIKIIDAWIIKTGGAGGAGDTVQLAKFVSGVETVIDWTTISLNVATAAIMRCLYIDYNNNTIPPGGTLRIKRVKASGANAGCLVNVVGIRV